VTVNGSCDAASFHTYTPQFASAELVGKQYVFRPWWTKNQLALVTDTSRTWVLEAYPDNGTHAHCELTWELIAAHEFAHGFSFEIDLVGVVHQPVEDGVGQGGIADEVVPLLDRQLAGDDGGALAVAVLEDLEQVAPLLGVSGISPQSSSRPARRSWRAAQSLG
jgi:hypothetical protein